MRHYKDATEGLLKAQVSHLEMNLTLLSHIISRLSTFGRHHHHTEVPSFVFPGIFVLVSQKRTTSG